MLSLYSVGSLAHSQSTIRGNVYSVSTGEGIEGATVVVKKSGDSQDEILGYGITTPNGAFSLKFNNHSPDSSYLEVKCIGFKTYTQLVDCNVSRLNIVLDDETFLIKEATVKALKIKQSGDTVSYNTASFATSKDYSIGDVLSNMPGITVADNGQISYNGAKISHFYIEGNDLFNERYSIATQNLSYKNISRVEVIENHQSIKALATTNNDSGRGVALNLKLKEEAKSKLGGYLQLAGGFHPDTWEADVFVAKFSSLFQSASTFKGNNSGKTITNENSGLTISDILNMQTYTDSRIFSIMSVNPSSSSGLKEESVKTGSTYMVNNSNLWKLSENTTVQSQVVCSDDNANKSQGGRISYYLTDSILTINTKEQYGIVERNLQAEVNLKNNQENYYLNNQLKSSIVFTDVESTIDKNRELLNQEYDCHQLTISNKFEFIKRSNSHILQIGSFNQFSSLPEGLIVSGGINALQNVRQNNLFSGTHISHSYDLNRWNFTTKGNCQIVGNQLNSELQIFRRDSLYLNTVRAGHIQLNVTPQLSFKNQGFTFSVQIPLRYYKYKIENKPYEHHFFCMPEIFMKWKTSSFFTIFANGSSGTFSSSYDNLFHAPVMSNYQTLTSGFLSFPGKERVQGTVRLSYANPIDMLFAHLSLSGSIDISDKQTEKTVTDSMLIYQLKSGSNKSKMRLVDLSLQKGLDLIRGKAVFHAMYQDTRHRLEQNGTIEPYNNKLLSTDITIKSTLGSIIDLEYKYRYYNNLMKSNLYKSQTWGVVQQFSGSISPVKDFFVKLQGLYYYNHNGSNLKQNIFLMDTQISHTLKRVELFGSVRNVLNVERYSNTVYNDLSTQTIYYNLRPRTIVLGFKYLF